MYTFIFEQFTDIIYYLTAGRFWHNAQTRGLILLQMPRGQALQVDEQVSLPCQVLTSMQSPTSLP